MNSVHVLTQWPTPSDTLDKLWTTSREGLSWGRQQNVEKVLWLYTRQWVVMYFCWVQIFMVTTWIKYFKLCKIKDAVCRTQLNLLMQTIYWYVIYVYIHSDYQGPDLALNYLFRCSVFTARIQVQTFSWAFSVSVVWPWIKPSILLYPSFFLEVSLIN
jgi:hypothetical protein